ncbi:MAG: S-methyl-5-thioribose-1-phosphate isomerase [Pirellulaceae bacterium]|nr:S-methyl-5-thioribose-1-phosphate isomerase [Pirellulaceae bacterium]
MPAPETIAFADDILILIDQTKLPGELATLECRDIQQTHDAIKRLVVRGAPAIGIAAAYGVCLARDDAGHRSRDAYLHAIEYLATSRPTAVNLFWALDRMQSVLQSTDERELPDRLLAEAVAIHDEDREMCHSIGRNGATLLKGKQRVLTHCNAGGLATSTWGTALAPIYQLHESGEPIEVYADETRPLLQGGRLTAWELSQAGVPVTVLTDSMAGSLLRTGKIGAVIVGADRIAANGDVANKIGTYPLAVLARYHDVPFYVAAPSSTFDLTLDSGDLIPIEERGRDEIAKPFGLTIVPDQAEVMNPAFDCTPAELVTAIITERGVVTEPNREKLALHLA